MIVYGTYHLASKFPCRSGFECSCAARRRCSTIVFGRQQLFFLKGNLHGALAKGILDSVPRRCSAAKTSTPHSSSTVERPELCRDHVLDSEIFCDWRKDMNSLYSLDFIGNDCKENLWMNSIYSPYGVDAKLAVLDNRIEGPGRFAFSCLLHQNVSSLTVPECHGYGTTEAVIELCEEGQLTQAIDALTVLAETQYYVSTSLVYRVIQRCIAEKNLVLGRRLDNLTVKLGYESNAFVGNHILRMYASQGRLQEAMKVFTRVVKPDEYMWFSIISAQAKYGNPSEAIRLYHGMCSSGLEPNGHIFVATLHACARAEDVKSGRQVHADVVESGIQADSFVCSCLVDMYAKCGELEDARRVFDSMTSRSAVTWNAMINGYAEHGFGPEALALYSRMEQEGLILADVVTFACLLKACASTCELEKGRELHSQIVERGLLGRDLVVGTCLVNMYAKCGKLDDARMVFDSLSKRDAVTWNVMISGYAEHGLGPEALAVYAQMERDGHVLADGVTFACLLKACASAGALQFGRHLHSRVVERGLLDGNVVVGTCLVSMYAKCGKLQDARMVFDSLAKRSAETWNAMISGYGRNNEGHEAIACFEQMILAGIQPNVTTFTCLLVACSHEGLVSKGRLYFDSMLKQHGLAPTIEHYNCMIDLLGRAGHTDEAESMLLSANCKSNSVGLMSLLNACKSHGDVERGARCFEKLLELDPQHASAYVLMANAYADADRWADVDRVERLRKVAGASKKPAVAGIEVNKQVHTFVVGEENNDLFPKVRNTHVRLQVEGNHVPQTKLVLKPLSEKEKEDDLCGHAEKLALAYGLLNTPDGTPLLVTKNLRMCRDCHSSTEIMSRVERRDIVVRDAYRVHRFEAGSCSCKGFGVLFYVFQQQVRKCQGREMWLLCGV